MPTIGGNVPLNLLLILCFAAFISIGLPNSILGSAWPIMYQDLHVSIGNAGIISMIISGGMILSGLTSARIIKRFGTGTTIVVGKAIMAASLIGFAVSDHFLLLCVFALPLGFGIGVIDTGVNGFIALHYKARYMSWLHSSWAVGAATGTLIMSFGIRQWGTWESGYLTIAIIQILLIGILIITLPRWKSVNDVPADNGTTEHHVLTLKELIRLPGVKQTLIVIFGFSGIQGTMGLWISSYLVLVRKVPEATAARWVVFHLAGVMVGRFLSGFLSFKMTDKQLILSGLALSAFGIALLFLPLLNTLLLGTLFLIGLGFAPIIPSIYHSTPTHFGNRFSQSVMGVQTASLFAGSTFVPPLFGLIAQEKYYGLFPYFLAAMIVLVIPTVFLLYRSIRGGEALSEPQDEVSASD